MKRLFVLAALAAMTLLGETATLSVSATGKAVHSTNPKLSAGAIWFADNGLLSVFISTPAPAYRVTAVYVNKSGNKVELSSRMPKDGRWYGVTPAGFWIPADDATTVDITIETAER